VEIPVTDLPVTIYGMYTVVIAGLIYGIVKLWGENKKLNKELLNILKRLINLKNEINDDNSGKL